jgi:NAD(P)-dependent dehydrogenase (short-subunit alcohol dehydrogenase family)
MSLAGKHALITGSSRGIGRGIALKLAEHGAKIAVHYYQNERAANDTLGQVRKRGSDGLVIQADVTRPEQITAMFRKVQAQFGSLDIFVSNARPETPAFFQPPMDITLEQWDAAFNSQAKAFLVAVREAVALMGDGGRIFAITYAEGRAAQVDCSRGLGWDQPRRRSSRSFVTSRWHLPNATSP